MKRKVYFIICYFIFTISLFSQTFKYQIKDVNYNITPCSLKFLGETQDYAISKNVSVNKDKIFNTKQELDEYIEDYHSRLNNTRAFDSILITQKYTISEDQEPDSIIPVTLEVSLIDSIHILCLPYPKYSSNEGLTLKLKVKDTNFLGTLNEMNSAFTFQLLQKDENQASIPSVGIEFSYDYPFKAGIFDTSWINDYDFSYTFNETSPEWNAKTGLEFTLPSKRVDYIFGVYQTFNRDFDYATYNDQTYAGEELLFKVPVTIVDIPNFAPLKYTSYVDFTANWDFTGININNSDLSSPYLTFGQSISLSRVNWKEQLRTGIDAELLNTFKYNFQRKFLYPQIALDLKAYKAFKLLPTQNFMNRFGICTNLYTFIDLYNYSNPYFKNDGENVGTKLRGLRDYQNYNISGMEDWYALRTPAAILINLDLPVHIFQTNFSSKFMKYLNFDFQLSPFIDAALTYNKFTNKWFDPKDGLYAGGVEVLVYPLKWSSFTVRGSIGLDLGRYLFADYLNTEWRENCSKYEISFGIGLQY